MAMPSSPYRAVVAIKLAMQAFRVDARFEDGATAVARSRGTARHRRLMGPGLTHSVTEKKNGESREALAV
jgi:hypothetical protein